MSHETAAAIPCPDCGALWPASMRTCPADGARLGAFRSTPPDLDDAPLAAGTQVGEYRVEDMLGAGGMGEVYRARHPVIDKRVAIKIMSRACSANPINVERFVQEAKAVNAIGHANIVDIFSFGHHDGRCFFVMEWLRGTSLRQRLDQTAVAPQRTYDILDAVLRALEAAHAAGIIHRDLKPDNIFLATPRDGEDAERVKLLDFGIAKLSDSGSKPRGSKTQTGTVVGTPAYMSPEQAGGGAIESASDIYSLGVVAYEMAAGRVPFDAESTVQIMAAHVCEPPPPPSTYRDVDADFEELILAMLHKSPEARPSSAEVRRTLARLRGRPITAPSVATDDLAMGPNSNAHAATALAPATPLPGSLKLSGQVTALERRTPSRALAQSDKIPRIASAVSRPLPVTSTPAPKIQISFEVPPTSLAGTGVVAPARRPYGWIALGVVALAAGLWFATRGSDEEVPARDSIAAVGSSPPPPLAKPEPVRAKIGMLALEVTPSDAVIAIDGTNQVLDAGKLDRPIDAGSYAITVSREGYRTEITTLVVTAAETTRWSVALVVEPAPVASVKPRPTSRPTASKPMTSKPTAKPVTTTPTTPKPPPRTDVDAVRDPFAPGGSK